MVKEAVVVLSGGMDSTTLLYEVLDKGIKATAITFDYGQRHRKEIAMARRTTEKLGLEHIVVDLSAIGKQLLGGSSLTSDKPIPHGHYEEDSMKDTVVPNRNMVLLSLAGAYAMSKGIEEIYYGAHAGDHAIYPDCRPEFVDVLGRAIRMADWKPVILKAPYLREDKGGILARGIALGVPYEDTWTCYEGLEEACGACGSCGERLEAFEKLGVKDPLRYRT